MVDLFKLSDEDGSHFLGDIPDDAFQLPLGVQHIITLGGKVGVTLVHTGIFLDGTQVGRTQSGDLPLQLADAAVAGGDGFDLSPMLRSSTGGQAVGVPQLVHDLFFLQLGGDLLLLQQRAGTLHVQDILVLLLNLTLRTGLGGFRLRTFCQNLFQSLPQILCLTVGLTLLAQQDIDLLFQTVIFLFKVFFQGQLLAPVALHGHPQSLQVLNVGRGSLTLGDECRFVCLQLRTLPGDGFGFLSCFRLAAFQGSDLGTGLLKLSGVDLDLGLLSGITVSIAAASVFQRLLLGFSRGHSIVDGLIEDLILLFGTLQLQHLILCLTQLIPGSRQLEFHLVHRPLGFRQLGLGHQLLVLQFLFPGGELLQLIGTGQNAGFLIHRTAGHRTAGVHDLTVQGDDLEAVAVFVCHGNGSIDVTDDDDAAQQILHDSLILRLGGHQLGSDAHEAPAAFQSVFLEASALNRGQGQEGGTSATGPLQEGDGCLTVLLGVHNDLLHGSAQSDLDGEGVAVLGADQLGHRSVDIGELPSLSLLHHQTDRLLIAFKITLHGTEHTGFCTDGIQLLVQFPESIGKFIPTLGTGCLPQGIACDGILGSGDLVLSPTQLASAVVQFLAGMGQTLLAGSQVLPKLRQPVLGKVHGLFQAPDICLSACQIGSQSGLLSPQLQKLTGHTLSIGGHGCQLLFQSFQSGLLLLQLCIDLSNTLMGLLDLKDDAAAAAFVSLHLLIDAVHIITVVSDVAPENGDLTVQLLMGGIQHTDLDTDVFQLRIPATQDLGQILRLLIQPLQIVLGLLQHEGGRGIVLLSLSGIGRQLIQRIQPDSHLHSLKLFLQGQVLLCLFRLDLQRLQLQFQLRDLVTNSHQVVFGMGQLPLGFFLAVAVLGNTGCFLKDLTTVCTFQRQNLIDTSLSDVGIALPAQTGIHKQFMDISQSGGLAIDIKFRISGAVIPAGDHDLIGIVGQSPVRVVQGQCSLCKAHCLTLLGATEDHVFHLGTTEGLVALLAHDPQNCVGNIRFTGAVGTNDGGDIVAEADQRLIREGLKALHFQ